jgi:hypothetical protein
VSNYVKGMRWSKVRSTIKELICSELRRRIDFHVTSYRHSHDEAEKAWITIDGKRALTASWYKYEWHYWPRDSKGRLDWERARAAEFPAHMDTQKDEVHLPEELGGALRTYIDLPIGAALQSENPFIRALSIVDRRTGKRRLQALQITTDDHSLVKAFYALRMSTIKSRDEDSRD